MDLMTRPLRILHLEDDAADGDLVKATLVREGIVCDIVRVEALASFTAAAREGQFDIILADFSLPGFDGLSALDIAKAQCPDIPFIFVTGKMGEELAIEALKGGATDYVLKDKLSRLVLAVRRALAEVKERSELKEAEQEIRVSHKRLGDLFTHLETVREDERERIARELHDELGQILTALKMDLAWLGDKCRDRRDLFEKTRAMTEIVDSTIQSVKRILMELRPAILDHLGLSASIEWQALDFQNHTGISCELIIDPPNIVIDGGRTMTLFRIFQEALTNVARHAEATRVTVSLTKTDDEIVLMISDDGKGITKEQLSKPRSFGILGVSERVRFWGGSVTVEGTAASGTTMRVALPLDPEE
jgi:signal transduction histidine kinase